MTGQNPFRSRIKYDCIINIIYEFVKNKKKGRMERGRCTYVSLHQHTLLVSMSLMRTLLKHTAVIFFVAVGAFSAGLFLGGRGYDGAVAGTRILFAGSDTPPAGIDFSPLWKAWRILEEKHVAATTTASTTPQEQLWGTIEGLAQSYGDPYTVFFPPKEAELFADDIAGEFGGVGMEIGMKNDTLTVIAPLKDTPTERAGILAGDYILQIDGKNTSGLSIDEAVLAIRGEPGTTVVLTIAREGESKTHDISVVREIIKIPTIKTHLEPNGIFVISLYNFGATSAPEFRNAVREFLLSASDKLIVDVRGNPGGYLEAATDIASWFLGPGEIVVREDFGAEREEEMHRSRGYRVLEKIPTVVLIDRGSASASEILAGALKDHGRATIVGERSFGKGSVQELVPITSDTSLKVTIARWLTPSGISISDGGLIPDVVVERTPEDFVEGKDPQLEKAKEILLHR